MTVYAGTRNTVTRFDEFVHRYDVDSNELVDSVKSCDEDTIREITNRVNRKGSTVDLIETIDARRLRCIITEDVDKEVTNNLIHAVLEQREGLYKINKIKTGWRIEELSKELLENKIRT